MRIILIGFFALFFSLFAQAQLVQMDKITLKTGEVYTGEIVARTSEFLMIKTPDGARFQFQITQIEKEEIVFLSENEPTPLTLATSTQSDDNMRAMFEAAVGIARAQNAFHSGGSVQLNLAFGTRRLMDTPLFVGAGVGYFTAFTSSSSEAYSFLPLFVRLSSTFTSASNSPYWELDGGYGLSLNDNYNGGLSARLKLGMSFRRSYKTTLQTGVFAGVQYFAGALTEEINDAAYSYHGNSVIQNCGITFSVLF